ncbi:MAG: ankyrin repeat domain-containing protein [Verrucomicrobiota bacterium]
MRLPLRLHLPKTGPLLIAAGLLVSCGTPQKRALRELSKAGIEPSGSALLQAVTDQDSTRTGWLLDVGVYTEQRDARGRTPVRIAIENRDVPSVFKLLAAKADVNATTQDQVSVLGVAVELGETAIVEKLLTAGARTDGRMPDGEKILPWAIRHGRLTFVRAMIKSGADPHLKDRQGNPLLHVAMESGRRDLVESLIHLGADPGATNAAGETTIQIAFRQGWLEAVPKLAAAGADPNARGADGQTLLDRAVALGDAEKIDLLLKIGADPNGRQPSPGSVPPLERIFTDGDRALFRIFLDHGAKPPEAKWDSWLWKALAKRDHEAARLLLSHGAQASTRGPHGLLLVESAALEGQGSFVKMLTDYGGPTGNALYQSSARGDLDMVGLLISCGAPVNVTQIPSRDTPLGAAIRNKQDRVASLLIHHGADVNLRLPEGQAPLHLAIATGCHRTVRDLLAAGADPNTPFDLPVSPDFLKKVRPGVILRWVLKNDRNVTPLMMAADSGVIPTARHLIRAGAKMETRTRTTHLWPINFASRRNDVKMMRLFLGRDPLQEERRIEISLAEQRARIYDSGGKEIFTTQVSTGKKGYATPTGEFVITNKYRDWRSTLYNDASMPYFQRLSCGDFGLHQGNVPGYPASHGCIRVPAGNAAKLYTMTQAGDRVKIMP